MLKVKTVDEYIANAPAEVRGKLETVRRIIKSVAPETERNKVWMFFLKN